MEPSTQAARAPPLVRMLQTAFLLPFYLAALCIPGSAAVSAVPVFLEEMKAFHRAVSVFTEYSESEGIHKDHQVQAFEWPAGD